ncbi:ubiquitin carboxyl-terminal hydrolase 16-like, partial [Exaiptasia diaphana]|uniref:MYND-type domain-containing protein n=1 Tax=Exaiptasia diaphana TaxID=2652724 RepID=A0A913YIR2_EXADI
IGESSTHDNDGQDDDTESSETDSSDQFPDRCGFCQRPSEALKKCTGCKNISYCDEDCQTKHFFLEHKYACSRSQDSSAQRADSIDEDLYRQILEEIDGEFLSSQAHPSCAFFLKPSKSLKKCTGCEIFFYCDSKCQAQHWKTGHKDVCSAKIIEDSSQAFFLKEDDEHDQNEQRDCCDVCEHPLQVVLKKCTGCHKTFYYGDDSQSTTKNCDIDRKGTVSPERTSSNEDDICRNNKPQETVQPCAFCKKPSTDLKKCFFFKQVSYCTKECQRKLFFKHKIVCH